MCARTYRILAVDDLPDNLFLLQTLLESEGYAVDVATNGRQALDQINSHFPDLILLDVMMPDMNGLEVTQRIRQNAKTSGLPILLLTAHGEAVLDQVGKVKADGLLRKPVDFEELLNNINQILQSRGDSHSSLQTT